MQIKLENQPGYACARVTLAPGEAMVAMSQDMGLTTTTRQKGKGGFLKAVKRMMAGETLFINRFAPGPQGGEVMLSPVLPGDLMVYNLEQESLIVQGGSWLASGEGVEVDMSWQGLKTLFSGESLFWLKLSGTGPVILNSFGAIYPLMVQGEAVVDTGHIVAFQEGLSFTISKPGKSWLSAFLGGEGFACRFKGNGQVWCQSHSPTGFGRAMGPYLLPVQR